MGTQRYTIDRELLRRQREHLASLALPAHSADADELLMGIVHLLESIEDQLEDRYGPIPEQPVSDAELEPDDVIALSPSAYEQAREETVCEWCKEEINPGEEESTPSGSMHADCANNYEQDKPEDW